MGAQLNTVYTWKTQGKPTRQAEETEQHVVSWQPRIKGGGWVWRLKTSIQMLTSTGGAEFKYYPNLHDVTLRGTRVS